jgi:hypothetical protein
MPPFENAEGFLSDQVSFIRSSENNLYILNFNMLMKYKISLE